MKEKARLELRCSPYHQEVFRNVGVLTVLLKKVNIPLCLFVGGLACFATLFLLPSHPDYFWLIGWSIWVCAYFVVLAQNYSKKPPVPTRGGLVYYEKQPTQYKFIYFVFLFAGIFVELFLLIKYLLHH